MKKVFFKLALKSLVISLFFGNKHYMKRIVRIYRKKNVVFEGKPKYIDRNASLDCLGSGKIFVGEGSVITTNVIILTHDYSIDCGLISIGKENPEFESQFIKDVHIGKNVFVGQRSIILPGVSIGDNCIIGAGCVVSKDIPSDSVVVGCPCKIIASTSKWAEKKLLEKEIKQGNPRIKK